MAASYRVRVGVRLTCALVAFALIVGSGYAWALYQNFTQSVPHGDAVPKLAAHQTDLDGSDQDILMIGNDSRAGATRAEQTAMHSGHDDGTVNTDTMMILHLPAGGGKPSVISFPRDSWVSIPGHGKGKLNSAYSDAYNAAIEAHRSEQQAEGAGILLTLRTLEGITGLHIDHYLQVNLIGFYRISEAIGGVTVCLKSAQNASTDKDAYGSGYSGINLPAGVSVIKGEQALAFVRQRHGLPHGDLDRIKRQQYFLESAFHKVATAGELLNPFKLQDLLKAVSSSLLTDPSLNLISLARSFELVTTGELTFSTLPNDGPQVIYPDGVETAIVGVDTVAVPDFIRSIIGKGVDVDLTKVTAAKPSSVTVDVLNGTSAYLLATRNAAQLTKLGFHTDTVDSTPSPVLATTVEYPPGHAAEAKAVLAAVPGAKTVETTSVARVTIELGSDGKQVRGLAPTPSAPSATSSTLAASGAKKSSSAKAAGGLGCID
ncbi:LCP family protein [Jatrophihabitans sp.]|uniref:LCP family protein n=1 Tax=Jatrophihabitans sp. TaxID=1932789 RepID=UPI0030C67FF4